MKHLQILLLASIMILSDGINAQNPDGTKSTKKSTPSKTASTNLIQQKQSRPRWATSTGLFRRTFWLTDKP